MPAVDGHPVAQVLARAGTTIGAEDPQLLSDSETAAHCDFVIWPYLTPPGDPTDTGGPEAFRRVLGPIAARLGATIPQVTLAWLLARSPAVMPIPATTSLSHLRENLAAQDLELTREDIRSIDELAPDRAA